MMELRPYPILVVALLPVFIGCTSPVPPSPDTLGTDSLSPDIIQVDGKTPDSVDTKDDTSWPEDGVVDTLPDISPPPDVEDASDTQHPPPDTTPPPSCADGNKCTIEYWDDELGECVSFPLGCPEESPCTAVACYPESGCEVTVLDLPGCCQSDAECEDDNPCTLNVCEKKTCQTIIEPASGCCQVPADCNDGDPCAMSTCENNICNTTFLGTPECCYGNGDCVGDEPCSVGLCIEGVCAFESTCCEETSQCPSPSPCASGDCIDGWCVQVSTAQDGCCDNSTPLFTGDFEGGAATGFEWENTDPSVGWQVATGGPIDTAYALYYGNPATWTYVGNDAHGGTVTTAPLTLPAATQSHLSFRLFLDVQTQPLLDTLQFRLVQENGDVITLWNKETATLSIWFEIEVNLSAFAGQTIQLEWRFETVTSESNQFLGVLLDDILLESDCALSACESDNDCDDGLTATEESCVQGICAYKAATSYCDGPWESCDDGNACTHDLCHLLSCIHPPIEGCCSFNSQCDDNNACTQDECGELQTCVHTSIEGCCLQPSDCDDGDPCSEDICTQTGCEHSQLLGCCDHNSDCFDGNDCTSDLCIGHACQHLPVCCAKDEDCPQSDPLCAEVSCVDSLCQSNYLGLDGCCKEAVWGETFDGASPLAGWTLVTDNDPEDNVGWQATVQLPSNSPPGTLYYGNPEQLSYATGDALNLGEIATPPVWLPTAGQTELRFHLYLANEYAAGNYANPDWDRLTVILYPQQGMPVVLWDSAWGEPIWWFSDPDGFPLSAKWVEVNGLMLTDYLDQSIQIGFRFDTKDASDNEHMGVIIDEISITTTCSP